MSGEEIKRKILSYVGFAKKSGNISVGAEQVMRTVRAGAARAVVAASDSSERTKKQIYDKCKSHGAPLVPVEISGDELARALGKSMNVSAIAVTNAGLARAILDAARDENETKERIFPHESGNR